VISVVVPAFNAEKTIDSCLVALAKQTVPEDRYEVIVVDDGSIDGTAARAEKRGVRILRQTNQGAAAARNHGAREARGELVLFTDADCVPAANWIEEMAKPFANPEVVGVKGIYRTRQSELAARFIQVEYEHKYERMRRRPQIDFVDTYSAAFRRDLFLSYNGFDTSFPSASVEDQEFSFRLAENGHKMVFQPTAAVFHRHQPDFARYLRRKFYVAYWKVRVLLKHPKKVGGDAHTPASLRLQIVLTYAFAAALLAAFLFPRALILAGLILVAFLASTLPFVFFARGRDPSVARLAPGVLFLRSIAFCAGLIAGAFGRITRR
jgi:glycosyltransferase involved in cell wall biosynthesis